MRGDRLRVANLKAIRAWNIWHSKEPWELHTHPFDNSEVYFICLGQYRKTQVYCSCPECCGNPRKRKGAERLTLAEQKALITAREQLDEVG
jgi:hypothetical protein